MRIGICNENNEDRLPVHPITEMITKSGMECEIVQFKNGQDLLNHVGEIDILLMESRLLDVLMRLMRMKNRHVILPDGVDSRTIRYIKAAGNYCEFYFINHTMKSYRYTISQCEEMLSEADFVRSHRGYLVSLNFVDTVTDKEIHMGEDVIPVSFRRKKNLRDSYKKYLRSSQIN